VKEIKYLGYVDTGYYKRREVGGVGQEQEEEDDNGANMGEEGKEDLEEIGGKDYGCLIGWCGR